MISLLVTVNPSGRFVGDGFIAGADAGIVSVAGVPARRKVVLIDKATNQVIGQTASANDGTFRFDRITADREYMVIALDHQMQFNAVIRDGVIPAKIPEGLGEVQ